MLAIGQYWQPSITEDSINEAAKRAAEELDDQDLSDTSSLDSVPAAGAQELKDRSAMMHEEMPLLKAHGTKHSAVAVPGSVLQDLQKAGQCEA